MTGRTVIRKQRQSLVLAMAMAMVLASATSINFTSCSHNTPTPEPTIELNPIEKGVRYLLSQQGDDGIWRSEYYGNLKQGAAVSAFVLYALAHTKPHLEDWPEEEFKKAFSALQPNILINGYVSNDEGPDYSNYGSAMYLLAAMKSGTEIPHEVEDKLVDYLIRSQLDEGEGFTPEDRDYGGWDLSGWMTGHRQTTGSNISVTSSVIEALVAYVPLPDDKNLPLAYQADLASLVAEGRGRKSKPEVVASIEKAIEWLKKCQNFQDDVANDLLSSDGGFFFHPKIGHDGNKGAWEDKNRKHARSYGTASADGYRSMKLIETVFEIADSVGGEPEDRFGLRERIEAGKAWLIKHNGTDRVPGFEWEDSEHGWHQGLIFYYMYSLAKAAKTIEFPSAESATVKPESRIKETLARIQRKNGSWQNRVARMREDDPLIATCFAIIALSDVESGKDE